MECLLKKGSYNIFKFIDMLHKNIQDKSKSQIHSIIKFKCMSCISVFYNKCSIFWSWTRRYRWIRCVKWSTAFLSISSEIFSSVVVIRAIILSRIVRGSEYNVFDISPQKIIQGRKVGWSRWPCYRSFVRSIDMNIFHLINCVLVQWASAPSCWNHIVRICNFTFSNNIGKWFSRKLW